MAVSKKYAGLPDLDAAPEIYETPELTDDASTVQTNTLRTESPAPPEYAAEPNRNFDRGRLNREEARRRFEPAVVDARDTNLSDAIGGNRRGYRTAHRRTRRRGGYRREIDGVEVYGDYSGESSGGEEEGLDRKLARLQREAEEVREELVRREREAAGASAGEEEFQDSYEHHQNGEQQAKSNKEMADDVEALSKALSALRTSKRAVKGESLEQEFSRRLAADGTGRANRDTRTQAGITDDRPPASTPTSSTSAIAAFADRLTALESALGLSPSLPTNTELGPVLPALDILSSQITVLTKTITPRYSTTSGSNTTNNDNTISDPPLPTYLDEISLRLRHLQTESETLIATRKAALQALTALQETRNRGSGSSVVYAKYLSKREAQSRQRDSVNTTTTTATDLDTPNTGDTQPQPSRPQSLALPPTSQSTIPNQIFTDTHASKISALASTLPTIHNLQPLLPLVLDRLRSLSALHAGAATAHRDMAELENRLGVWEAENKKWKEALEGVEKGMEEAKEVMQGNLRVVGEMVAGVEGRVGRLGGDRGR